MRPVTSPSSGADPVGARHARARTFGGLLRHRDFAALWVASTQSQLGDQLARVALSVLVFARTGSGLATAATYALTYLPAVVGGVLFAGLADLLPRRGLLVCCDLLRAALFALMALPGLPLWAVCTFLALAVLAGSRYGAAAPAVVSDMFTGDTYVTAQGLRTASAQAAQLIGFAVGGLIVAAIGARATLVLDAATFAISALLLQIGLVARPAAVVERRGRIDQLRVGVHTVVSDRRLRVLIGLTWLYAFWIIPEGVAAPYAAARSAGPVAVGVLLAAAPLGSMIGVLILTRWVPTSWRPRLLYVLAPAAGVPLLGCLAEPPVAVAAILWAASGVFTAYLVIIVPEFVSIVSPDVRGQTIGIAASGLLAAQGIGLLLGGAFVAFWSVGTTVAVGGAIGVVLSLPLARAWRAATRAQADELVRAASA